VPATVVETNPVAVAVVVCDDAVPAVVVPVCVVVSPNEEVDEVVVRLVIRGEVNTLVVLVTVPGVVAVVVVVVVNVLVISGS